MDRRAAFDRGCWHQQRRPGLIRTTSQADAFGSSPPGSQNASDHAGQSRGDPRASAGEPWRSGRLPIWSSAALLTMIISLISLKLISRMRVTVVEDPDRSLLQLPTSPEKEHQGLPWGMTLARSCKPRGLLFVAPAITAGRTTQGGWRRGFGSGRRMTSALLLPR